MAQIPLGHLAPSRCPVDRPDGITITVTPVSELKINPNNPRNHSARQIRQLAESIRVFGFNVPILVDANLQVIAGHGRVLAARRLGLAEAPTICLSHLSETQAQAFMIADNRFAENASWDELLLAEQLKALSLLNLDFNLEVTGFEMGEIDLKIAGLEAVLPADDPADAALELASGPTISKAGDLWILGDHRVVCGSILDLSALEILMGSERAAMIFSDPPYNVPIDGHASGLGNIHHRPFAMATGEMSLPAFSVFWRRACGTRRPSVWVAPSSTSASTGAILASCSPPAEKSMPSS